MARLEFAQQLRDAWGGEATDFTPLLAESLDALSAELGVDLESVGKTEVLTDGSRRIDIVAQDADGSEFVIENQYRRADHDHLTRGLAYAVARNAKGLVVVAEEHRDEFRAVATYLNDLAENNVETGIAVWLVEVKAVRIENSPWAPLFSVVVQPNRFTQIVAAAKKSNGRVELSRDEFLDVFVVGKYRAAAAEVIDGWLSAGYRCRFVSRNDIGYAILNATGPSKSGTRRVASICADGHVSIPFAAYAGINTGIPVPALTSDEFRSQANRLFGFDGSQQGRTQVGWLTSERTAALLDFCFAVAKAYEDAIAADGLDI